MKTIFLIDDDRLFHSTIKHLLKQINGDEFSVVDFFDGKPALEFLLSNLENVKLLPDLILLDINLPEMNGWEFLNAYERISQSIKKTIEIFMITASVSNYDKSMSKSFRIINGYIAKPLSPEMLGRIIS